VARAQLFLDLVAHGYVGQNVVAVTHEGFIKNVVLPAIGVPTTNRSAFGAGMGTISLVSHDGAAWRAVFLACEPRQAARRHPPVATRSEGG
jgi:broad specificity phosphatase PhoE